MSDLLPDEIKKQSVQILREWLESCTRNGKIARNTVAMGIVVFDHLRRACPVSRAEVISQGGEVSGARSGLGKILESYGIPSGYLKEVTTRQGHQDGQRLFDQLEWGRLLAGLTEDEKNKFNGILDQIYQKTNEVERINHIQLEIDQLRTMPANQNVVRYLRNQQAFLIREARDLPRTYQTDERFVKG